MAKVIKSEINNFKEVTSEPDYPSLIASKKESDDSAALTKAGFTTAFDVPYAASTVKGKFQGNIAIKDQSRIVHLLAAKIDGSNAAVGVRSKAAYFAALFTWSLIKKQFKYLAVKLGADIATWVVDRIIFKEGVTTIHLPVLGDVSEEQALEAVDQLEDYILLKIG